MEAVLASLSSSTSIIHFDRLASPGPRGLDSLLFSSTSPHPLEFCCHWHWRLLLQHSILLAMEIEKVKEITRDLPFHLFKPSAVRELSELVGLVSDEDLRRIVFVALTLTHRIPYRMEVTRREVLAALEWEGWSI